MAHIFNGPYDKLTDIDTADISNGDTARIRLGGYDRLMVFDSTATNATDTANLPVYIRPHDYAAAGVWVESVGHYSNLSINASQLATSIIKSLNVTTTTGAQWDLDNELFKMGGTNVNFALSSTPGIIFGLDSGAYKLSIGDATGAASAQSFIKWDGSLSIRMASGETFDLYGGISIYDGGDITLNGNDSIGDKAEIIFHSKSRMACDSDGRVGLWSTDGTTSLFIGYEPDGDETPTYKPLYAWLAAVTNQIQFSVFGDNTTKMILSDGSWYLNTYTGTGAGEYQARIQSYVDDVGGTANIEIIMQEGGAAISTVATIEVDGITFIDGYHVGLGPSAGRLVFNDKAVDEILVKGAAFGGQELSTDPADPDEGHWVIWMSDGTGAGDDGDIMIKSTANSTTKTGTLFDHSAA
jgi:hypothetical protein